MKKKTKLLFLLVVIISIMTFVFLSMNTNKIFNKKISATIEEVDAPTQATATDNIASGTSGTCSWLIDKEGKLIIWPTNDTNGTLGNITSTTGAPWYEKGRV